MLVVKTSEITIQDFVEFDFTDAKTEIQDLEKFRLVSDGIGILYFLIMYFFIGLLFIFDPNYDNASQFYSHFEIGALLFFISIYFNYRSMRFHKLSIRKYFIHIFEGVFISLGLYFGLYLLWQVFIFNLFPIYEIPLGSFLTYQYSVSIPLEEMLFRGLFMSLIVFFFSKVFRFNIESAESKTRYYVVWILASIATGIIFGLYHVPKYVDSYYPYYILEGSNSNIIYVMSIVCPILYLSLFGIILGIIRMRYGMIFAILIHILNNTIANIGGFLLILYLTSL